MSCDRASIYALDTDDSLTNKFGLKIILCSPIRCQRRGVADNESCNPNLFGLIIKIINASVSDMRRSHHHDLLVVGRVCQSFLISSHTRLENCFPETLSSRSPRRTFKNSTIVQDKVCTSHYTLSLSVTDPLFIVCLPLKKVCRINPGSSCPW